MLHSLDIRYQGRRSSRSGTGGSAFTMRTPTGAGRPGAGWPGRRDRSQPIWLPMTPAARPLRPRSSITGTAAGSPPDTVLLQCYPAGAVRHGAYAPQKTFSSAMAIAAQEVAETRPALSRPAAPA